MRAPIKGGTPEILVNGVVNGLAVANPSGIALDTNAGKLYWTDFASDVIMRTNMPEKPVYDNGFVTHAIPQCSLQYSWIKASAITDRTQLLGYQTSGSY